MQEILYRRLIASDYNAYKKIRLDCLKQFPGNFGSTYEEELNAGSLKLDSAIKTTGSNDFAFGAFTANNNLIGICGFITEKRLKTSHRGEIIHMYVDPVFAGNGIGKKLLQISIDKAFQHTTTEQIILGVMYTNENAVNLYKQLGFIEYGRLENYFRNGIQYSTQLFLCLTKKNIQPK